ncbi:c-type cytochrome [Nocardia sp. alder85J]|uniref:cytochrome bc1 complex diheme cytochrome c subunit n=1 Tax=Nocardia sp. alder85J TaxID=2862949 RepID=UPI001CD46A0A|nr:cytochrome c [Nocardia sp. alder85J]MCX4098725.1 cytochrome c [Nocardia sp. alder85J]
MSSSPPSAPDPISGVDGVSSAQATKTRKQRRLRRKLAGSLVLLMGLVGAGFAASALTPHAQVATADEDQAALIREGKQLYDTSCVTCHGANLQGIQDRGPSLIGVGEAAVYFQVSTGRMPAAANSSQIVRKPPKFDEHQTDALSAFVASNGGGPTVVRDPDGSIAEDSLIKNADLGRGGELFRMNCASCHNFTGKGGALSSGKFAPPLESASAQQIYDAMLTGPQNMPKFSDRQLSPEEKRDIIAYLKNRMDSHPEGGYGLGGLGPATEGLAIWVVGIVALVGSAMWIGSRS